MKFYEIDLFPVVKDKHDYVEPVAVVKLKSITQVANFLESVDFDYLYPHVWTPKNNQLDPMVILKIWRS